MRNYSRLLKAIPFRALLLWILFAYGFYFILALLNLSNEDVYNWDLNLIFSEGGLINQIALLLIPVWLLTNLIVAISFLLKIRSVWKQQAP